MTIIGLQLDEQSLRRYKRLPYGTFKKGVKYIACRLGGDAARIKDIYQQNLSPKGNAEFLGCSNSSGLPIEVARAIKELIK